jgi:hypothetical protein
MKTLIATATAALALSTFAAPVFAQTAAPSAPAAASTAWYLPTSFYGTLGYTNLNVENSPHADNNAVTGRVGARFGSYIGVEGEATGGFGSDTKTVGGDMTRTHLQDQYAGYVVGFLPVTQKIDLLARVGYGANQYHVNNDSAGTAYDHHYNSVNYGAGAQYSFNGKDGVRADYTRFEGDGHGSDNSNVYSVAYVRKF